MRPAKNQLLMVVVIAFMIVVAYELANSTLAVRIEPTTSTKTSLIEYSTPPKIIVTYQNRSYYGAQHTYMWKMRCEDYGPIFGRPDLEYLTTIRIVNCSELTIGIKGFREPEKYHLVFYSTDKSEYIFKEGVQQNVRIQLNQKSYYLVIIADWWPPNDPGETSNIFKIELITS
ncbi:MAG: hypothetical protein QXJ17_02350 [Nitrososphaeria archaeon]